MVRAGAALPEVGQVLRHRRLLTTSIYDKVDIDGLRELARPGRAVWHEPTCVTRWPTI
jgi:integrase/recombinase XerD